MGADDLSIPDGERYDFKQLYNHPQYDKELQVNDIAILMVDRTIKFSETISPICLPSAGKRTSSKATVIGWGAVQYNGKSSDILKKVNLNVMSTRECRKMAVFDEAPFNPRVMICAAADHLDSCDVIYIIMNSSN